MSAGSGTSRIGSSSSSSSTGSSSSGGTSSNGALSFVGNWQVAGTYTVTLDTDAGPQTFSSSSVQPAQGYTVSFALNRSDGLVSLDSYGCQIQWTVAGNTANSVAAPASCTFNGGTGVLAWETGGVTITVVDANDLSGSLDLTGYIEGVDGGPGNETPASTTCVGTLTRVGG
jgi:hypothetical protein